MRQVRHEMYKNKIRRDIRTLVGKLKSKKPLSRRTVLKWMLGCRLESCGSE
jgi:hypothetical protein